MPTIVPVDPLIWPVLTDTLSALQAALAANPNPPAHYRVVPGIIPIQDIAINEDECCTGIAYVRLVTSFPTDTFPAQLDTANRLSVDPPSYAAVVEMGTYRCVDSGNIYDTISDDSWTQAAEQIANDAKAMRVVCAVMQQVSPYHSPYTPINQSFVLGEWSPVETEGGCVGGTQQFTMQVMCP